MTICISVYDNLYSLVGPTGPEGGIDRTEALAKDTFQYAAVCPERQSTCAAPGPHVHQCDKLSLSPPRMILGFCKYSSKFLR